MPREETTRLVRALEAFAFAAGVSRDEFVEALRVVCGPGAERRLDSSSPYRIPASPESMRAEETTDRRLAWVDEHGVVRAWVAFEMGTKGTPEAWRWEVSGIVTDQDDAVADGVERGETASFVGAYSKVVEHLGAEVSKLAALPPWARAR